MIGRLQIDTTARSLSILAPLQANRDTTARCETAYTLSISALLIPGRRCFPCSAEVVSGHDHIQTPTQHVSTSHMPHIYIAVHVNTVHSPLVPVCACQSTTHLPYSTLHHTPSLGIRLCLSVNCTVHFIIPLFVGRYHRHHHHRYRRKYNSV